MKLELTTARQALDDPNRKLVLTTPEAIETLTDPWDPATAPSAKQAEVAQHARRPRESAHRSGSATPPSEAAGSRELG